MTYIAKSLYIFLAYCLPAGTKQGKVLHSHGFLVAKVEMSCGKAALCNPALMPSSHTLCIYSWQLQIETVITFSTLFLNHAHFLEPCAVNCGFFFFFFSFQPLCVLCLYFAQSLGSPDLTGCLQGFIHFWPWHCFVFHESFFLSRSGLDSLFVKIGEKDWMNFRLD